MEHIEDDRQFLRKIRMCLKDNGKLLLEVPRLAPFPLGEPLWPYHKREYNSESLKKTLIDSGFAIEETYDGNRHKYVDIQEAREALFLYAKRINTKFFLMNLKSMFSDIQIFCAYIMISLPSPCFARK